MALPDVLLQGNVWSNLHELNLDWILQKMVEAVKTVQDEATSIEEFKKAITEEFEKLSEVQKTQFEILRQDWLTLTENIIDKIIPQFVRFTVSADGRLVAWIPEQWDELHFVTYTDDADSPLFGCLQIEYKGAWRLLS